MSVSVSVSVGMSVSASVGAGVAAPLTFNGIPPELPPHPFTPFYRAIPQQGDWDKETIADESKWPQKYAEKRWDPQRRAFLYLKDFLCGSDEWSPTNALLYQNMKNATWWRNWETDPGAVRGEINQLYELMKEERDRFLPEIFAQHDNAPVYWASFLGLNRTTHFKTFEAMAVAVVIGEVVGVTHKEFWKRPRPSEISPGLMPPFGPPAHPSFPAGHALTSHLLSHCLNEITKYDRFKIPLDKLARRVAKNRERAGFHYESDSAGGEYLANVVFNLLSGLNRYKDLVVAAKAEWP
jgi:hypothetical protein